jgi:hypothetical protein
MLDSPDPILIVPIAVLLSIAGLMMLFLWQVRRSRKLESAEDDREGGLRIDVASLPSDGPPSNGTQLECYHVPVRLVVLVLAPVGHGSLFPPRERLPDVINQLLPDFMCVLDAHKPIFQRWPNQVSSQGFVKKFFRYARLPGDAGKGTPWCSVAGKFEADGDSWLIGLILRADRPNSLGQIAIERATQWLDVLRIKRWPP